MSPLALLLLSVFLLGNASAQLLLKTASVRSQRTAAGPVWWRLARQPYAWIGILIYGIDCLVWLAFLSMVPLWQAVMVANLDILLVMVCGRFFFGELLTRPRVLAVTLITAGVIMVGWQA